VPVEIVSGSHDMTVLTSIHSRALVAALPDAHLDFVDGGRHALHHSHPGAVVEALGRLDRRVASGPTSPLQGALRRLTSVFPRSA
jgi:pimeloyl-ACP methyl ester carboxylesterase